MKKEEFCEIFGEINEKHIIEARTFHKNKKSAWLKWGSIAACFILLITCIATVKYFSPFETDEISTNESLDNENNPIEVLQNGDEESDKQTVDQSDYSDQTTNTPDNHIISVELQNRIDELSSADSLGWIVYNGSIYMQNWQIDSASLNKEKDNIELSESLGYAGDFIGYYQNSADRDVYVPNGVVYMVADNPDILCIKLNNGGTVWLGIEK